VDLLLHLVVAVVVVAQHLMRQQVLMADLVAVQLTLVVHQQVRAYLDKDFQEVLEQHQEQVFMVQVVAVALAHKAKLVQQP
jgi:hypothetical protein